MNRCFDAFKIANAVQVISLLATNSSRAFAETADCLTEDLR